MNCDEACVEIGGQKTMLTIFLAMFVFVCLFMCMCVCIILLYKCACVFEICGIGVGKTN